jgi:hypothetical protein
VVEMGPSILRRVDRWLFGRFEGAYPRLLEANVIGDCETLLDVGCGASSPIASFSGRLKRTVGVDAHDGSIEASRAKGIHSEYRLTDANDIDRHFSPGSFDCVVALDLIEHLGKEQGLELISKMERIALRRVIIFTPNGFLPQGETDGNVLQRHLSGWGVDEMRGLGYQVIGVNGLKGLRGEYARVRWRPTMFWERISNLTQLLVEGHPEHAFQLLCVKRLAR